MSQPLPPAFYVMEGEERWKGYINLLHIPYTLWALSFIVMGASLAPILHWDRLAGTLAAFFMAVGLCCHCLDELNGRPLGTRIPTWALWTLAVVSMSGAVALGVTAILTIAISLTPFVVFGVFFAVAYNLELWHGRFHSDVWYAFGWGAFPAFTAYWANHSFVTLESIFIALGCFGLALVQRTLSSYARNFRRNVNSIHGYAVMINGERSLLDKRGMVSSAERCLQILTVTVVIFALALLAYRA